jgi:hypothetical protein
MNADLLKNLFSYHTPDSAQVDRMREIRKQALVLATLINVDGDEPGLQTLAIRALHSATMHANAAIVNAGWDRKKPKGKVSSSAVEASAAKIENITHDLPPGWKPPYPRPSEREGGENVEAIGKDFVIPDKAQPEVIALPASTLDHEVVEHHRMDDDGAPPVNSKSFIENEVQGSAHYGGKRPAVESF